MKKIHIVILLLLGGLSFFNNIGQAQTAMFVDKDVASDRAANDWFGGRIISDAVAIYGDYAVVGAYGKDAGIFSPSGEAYLFKWIASSCEWIEVDQIFAQDTVGGPPLVAPIFFGLEVSIYGDMIAITGIGSNHSGVVGCGAVYIYKIVADEAVFVQKVVAFNETGAFDGHNGNQFGTSVDLSANNLIVGSQFDATRADGDLI